MKDHFKWNTALFWGFHFFCLFALITPFHWGLVLLVMGSYFIRMFFITAGYHRYFSHRAFETSRAFQFFLAFMAMTSSQKGVLWWAGHHRHHHRHSDDPHDLHSPNRGFWWSHCGWFLSSEFEAVQLDRVRDLAKYPELQWLERHWWVPVATWFALMTLLFGVAGFIYGGFIGTVVLWHGTFTINSLSHVWGTQPFVTGDRSRNNPVLAAITLGEGWHNNHHHSPSAARNGFRWFEYDVTFWTLKLLNGLGLIWNLRRVRET